MDSIFFLIVEHFWFLKSFWLQEFRWRDSVPINLDIYFTVSLLRIPFTLICQENVHKYFKCHHEWMNKGRNQSFAFLMLLGVMCFPYKAGISIYQESFDARELRDMNKSAWKVRSFTVGTRETYRPKCLQLATTMETGSMKFTVKGGKNLPGPQQQEKGTILPSDFQSDLEGL